MPLRVESKETVSENIREYQVWKESHSLNGKKKLKHN